MGEHHQCILPYRGGVVTESGGGGEGEGEGDEESIVALVLAMLHYVCKRSLGVEPGNKADNVVQSKVENGRY